MGPPLPCERPSPLLKGTGTRWVPLFPDSASLPFKQESVLKGYPLFPASTRLF